MIETAVVEPLGGPADLDGVIAIEDASFNNPTSRAWYEAELARPDVCKVFVIRTPERSVAGFAAFWKVLDEMGWGCGAPRWKCDARTWPRSDSTRRRAFASSACGRATTRSRSRTRWCSALQLNPRSQGGRVRALRTGGTNA